MPSRSVAARGGPERVRATVASDGDHGMPRYYFDVREAGTCVRDEVGLDLRDDDEARLHAGTRP